MQDQTHKTKAYSSKEVILSRKPVAKILEKLKGQKGLMRSPMARRYLPAAPGLEGQRVQVE